MRFYRSVRDVSRRRRSEALLVGANMRHLVVHEGNLGVTSAKFDFCASRREVALATTLRRISAETL